MGRILRYQCVLEMNRSSSDKGLSSDKVQILEEDLEMGKEEERR